ncbi:putative activating transcription factor 7-interacting protein 1 [Penaeus vannamei]|uniref:Putative activating transcription factor 7-interacting protein 1 n=1 Tax=Penaeus vannamei TaxID=6689 RepID=A0A423U9A1_PENVA|nr:putative activating transcription factor 7-interacting protein 1 [Penaeus vannamei]
MKAMDQAAPMITVPAGVLKEFMSPANSRTPTPPATASVTTSAVSKSSTPTPAASSNSRTPSPALPSSSETPSASLHAEKVSVDSPARVSLTNGDINSDSSTQDVDLRMESDTSDASLTESSRAVDEKTSVEGASEGIVNGTGVKRPSDEDNELKKPDLKKIRVFAPAEEDGFKKGDISIAVQEFNQHLDKASKKLEEAGKTDLDNIKADSFNSANSFFNDDKTNHTVQPPANNVRSYDVEVISSPSKDIEVLPVLPNDKDKETLTPVSVEKAPAQDRESKHIKKKLQRLSRKDLENMIMRLFSEKILHQTELGKLKQLCERSESTLETNRKKTAQFHKEVEDLRKVTNRLSAEHAARKGQYVAPIRIKRSVGIQASPHIINKGILHANGSAGVIKTIAPRASALVGVGNASSPIRPTTVQSTDTRKQSIPPPNVTFNTQMIPTSSSTNNVVSGGPVGLLASSQGVSNIATNSSLSTVTNPVASIGTVRPSAAGQMLMVAQPGMMQTIPRASGAGVVSKTTSAVIPVAQRRVVHTSLGNRVAAPRPAGLGPTPGTLVKVPVTGATQLVAIPQAGQVVLLPPVSGGQPTTALVVSNVTINSQPHSRLTALIATLAVVISLTDLSGFISVSDTKYARPTTYSHLRRPSATFWTALVDRGMSLPSNPPTQTLIPISEKSK